MICLPKLDTISPMLRTFLLACVLLPACMPDPCVTIVGNGLIARVDCTPMDTDGSGSSGNPTEGAEDTGAPDTGTGTSTEATGGSDASSTGDEVCMVPAAAGEVWGPCVSGACGGSLVCTVGALGDICIPPCDGSCPVLGCMGGVCDAPYRCVPQCQVDADCPAVGMVCDGTDVTTLPICMWPNG